MSSAAEATVGTQLAATHQLLQASLPGISRVAAAIYDPKTDRLQTFVHSTAGETPLTNYEMPLAKVPSLAELAFQRSTRIVNDLDMFSTSTAEHSRRLLKAGYRSSFTTPFFEQGKLAGFLFFDSREPSYFTRDVVERVVVFARLAALSVLHSLMPVRMLHSALRVAANLSHFRDPETGAHLNRMSRYARLIARGLAARWRFSDEFIEFVFLFAPLHDIGKIAIPDKILLKSSRLSAGEFEIMKSHVKKGAEMVAELVRDLGLEAVPNIDILRNVVLYHHEAFDGSGYPEGLSGDAIPIEARIIGTSDVFDALTSERPYKKAWGVHDALKYLRERSGSKFDRECVAALSHELRAATEIQRTFVDDDTAPFQSREGYTRDL
jgi:HD-GYP domain-containing protein (c-di-GMP phosphodiesterase class II)